MHKITSLDPTALQILLGRLDPPLYYKEKRKPSLLLVDDEPRLLRSLVELLKDSDYQLITATNGHEAIEQLTKHDFDIVLLDLFMPEKNGHDVLDYIKNSNIEVDVVILSGCTDFEEAVAVIKHNVSGYLRKPFQPEELFEAIANILKRQQIAIRERYESWLLESSEEFYRFLINSLPDFIYMLNAEGVFVFVNEQACQLLGYDPDELIGKHFSQIVYEEDFPQAYFVFTERRIGERASHNVEFRVKRDTSFKKNSNFKESNLSISCSSIGIYSQLQKNEKKKFLGTYGIIRDITEHKRAEKLAIYQANHDILTGLPNRRLLCKQFDSLLIQAQKNNTNIVLLLVDLDRFKLVNDVYGHTCGDELLRSATNRMQQNIRQDDTLARLGGDEFVVLLPDIREQSDVLNFVDKFLNSLNKPFYLGKTEIRISASIGITFYPKDGETMDQLISNADIAMYQVKSKGKNGYGFYESSMSSRSNEKILAHNELSNALDKGEFEMYYQPQVDMVSGKIIGAEGLIRWNHPKKGLVSAGEFIGHAEENGLVIPISEWTIDTIFKTLNQWSTNGHKFNKVSINLSPTYLERCDFATKIQIALEYYKISPSQIEIEILENVNIINMKHIIVQLKKLSKLGVKIAIDDFGTGYASLTYLKHFPIDTIKLDRSFVKEITEDNIQSPIILAIISIAKGLKLNLIAEGVETNFQSSFLKQEGCFLMQGYLYSRPLPQDQFFNVLKDSKKLWKGMVA